LPRDATRLLERAALVINTIPMTTIATIFERGAHHQGTGSAHSNIAAG
jgi:hypothetical protein